ncbi:MAG: FKBP-type peptidyl-prolyl cis-trans isomerase [Bacteroidales bacterium]|nr:FKBP-type peptidyl-prolyl cis-trans isomerase [Bacteroidales bacterium]
MILRQTYMILALLLLLSGCHRNNPTGSVVSSTKEQKEDVEAPYVEGNKRIIHLENEEIELFIQRYGWKMEKTGTGLYVQILDEGRGELIKEDDMVHLQYQTFLLSGEKIYDSKEDGEKVFKVAKSEEINGLHEAVRLLRPGGKARLIIPSYMAYGVAGDGDKVDGREPVVMIVQVVQP